MNFVQSSAPQVQPGNNAQTFTYRELAIATNNFRQDSFIGEGGFGVVHKGKLESTGQVIIKYRLLFTLFLNKLATYFSYQFYFHK